MPGGPCDGAGAADNGVAPTTFLPFCLFAFLLALVELPELGDLKILDFTPTLALQPTCTVQV